jgi:predicted dehydrogenase
MSQRLRLGWIGAGEFACWGLLPCLRDCPNIALVALCDRDGERARRAAERFGAARWHTDAEALLRNEELDAVAVIGPPLMALELAILCLERGLPVFVEKPLGRNEREARALAAIAAQHRTTGQVGFNWRHAPAFRKAHELIQSPEFGVPTYLESHHHEPGGCARTWGSADEVQAYLWVHGVHAVDQLRFQFGEVTEVFSRALNRDGVTVLTSSVRFANGATGWLSLHGGFPHTDASVLAVGDRRCCVRAFNFEELEYRCAEADSRSPAGLRAGYAGFAWRANFTENRPERMGYRQELESFAAAVLNALSPVPCAWPQDRLAVRPGGIFDHTEPTPSLADAVRTMRLCDAIYESAVAGTPVPV